LTLDELKEDDELLEVGGVRFALSKEYKDQYSGVTIDYIEKDGMGGFIIRAKKRSD
jgi:Fe-S cluster assembly iron-binding protein IscA